MQKFSAILCGESDDYAEEMPDYAEISKIN